MFSFAPSQSRQSKKKCIKASTSRAFNFIFIITSYFEALIHRNLFNAKYVHSLIEILNFFRSTCGKNKYFHVCISIIFYFFRHISVWVLRDISVTCNYAEKNNAPCGVQFGLGQVSNRNVSNKNELFIIWDSETKNGGNVKTMCHDKSLASLDVFLSFCLSVCGSNNVQCTTFLWSSFFSCFACIHFCISFCSFISMCTTDCCSIQNIFKPIQVKLIENWKWKVKQLTFSLSLCKMELNFTRKLYTFQDRVEYSNSTNNLVCK